MALKNCAMFLAISKMLLEVTPEFTYSGDAVTWREAVERCQEMSSELVFLNPANYSRRMGPVKRTLKGISETAWVGVYSLDNLPATDTSTLDFPCVAFSLTAINNVGGSLWSYDYTLVAKSCASLKSAVCTDSSGKAFIFPDKAAWQSTCPGTTLWRPDVHNLSCAAGDNYVFASGAVLTDQIQGLSAGQEYWIGYRLPQHNASLEDMRGPVLCGYIQLNVQHVLFDDCHAKRGFVCGDDTIDTQYLHTCVPPVRGSGLETSSSDGMPRGLYAGVGAAVVVLVVVCVLVIMMRRNSQLCPPNVINVIKYRQLLRHLALSRENSVLHENNSNLSLGDGTDVRNLADPDSESNTTHNDDRNSYAHVTNGYATISSLVQSQTATINTGENRGFHSHMFSRYLTMDGKSKRTELLNNTALYSSLENAAKNCTDTETPPEVNSGMDYACIRGASSALESEYDNASVRNKMKATDCKNNEIAEISVYNSIYGGHEQSCEFAVYDRVSLRCQNNETRHPRDNTYGVYASSTSVLVSSDSGKQKYDRISLRSNGSSTRSPADSSYKKQEYDHISLRNNGPSNHSQADSSYSHVKLNTKSYDVSDTERKRPAPAKRNLTNSCHDGPVL